jgi:HK97 family phage portal protein
MGFISSILESRAVNPAPFSLKNPPDWVKETIFGGMPTSAGQNVSEEKALTLSTVFSCVRIISNSFAMIPLVVYKKLDPRGKERLQNSQSYKLLHDTPNPEQSSFEWRRLMATHMLLWGAGISEIERDANGFPVALWPIPPWRVTVKRSEIGDKTIFYEILDVNGSKRYILPENIVVFTFFSLSVETWKSPIAIHRETLGSALAVKEYGAKTFGSGINPSAILSGVSFNEEDTEESIQKKYGAGYSGLNSGSRLMLLEEGVNFERVGLPPEDAQYLETRKMDVAEVARIYNVPLYMLNEIEKQTSWGTGVEEQKDGFVTFSMLPIYVQAEQELNRKVIFEKKAFCEFLLAGLLRGTLGKRAEAYKTFVNMGVYSPDDIREMENENPIPDGRGNIYMVPLNMQSLEWAGEKPDKAPKDAAKT